MDRSGWEWSRGPLGGPGAVGRPSWRAESGREALSEGREWLGMVWSPSWLTGSGRNDHLEGREWSGSPLGLL